MKDPLDTRHRFGPLDVWTGEQWQVDAATTEHQQPTLSRRRGLRRAALLVAIGLPTVVVAHLFGLFLVGAAGYLAIIAAVYEAVDSHRFGWDDPDPSEDQVT
jgi:hypothetical protein